MFEDLTRTVLDLASTYGYLVVLVFTFLETSMLFPLLPSEVVVPVRLPHLRRAGFSGMARWKFTFYSVVGPRFSVPESRWRCRPEWGSSDSSE